MKAVSYVINNHDDFKNSLVDIEKAKPTLKERDVLVKVQAISVNPVDTKVRKNSSEANNRILRLGCRWGNYRTWLKSYLV